MSTRIVFYLSIFIVATIVSGCSQSTKPKAALNTALLQAAGHDNVAEIKSLLAKGADPNTRGLLGYTPIMFVAFHSDAATIQLLQKAGGDIDAVDENGYTALMHAAPFNWLKQAKVLLMRGANVNIADKYGNTALMSAIDVWEPMVRLLLDHGANVNAQNRKGRTALLQAVAHPSEVSAHPQKIPEPSADETAGLRARFDSSPPAARERMKKAYGLPANASTTDFIHKVYEPSSPASDTAQIHKFYPVRVHNVRMLLSKGADVNIKTKIGFTPLMAAALYGNVEMLVDLLKYHPDINARDSTGRTALQIAKLGRKPEAIIPLLKKAGAKE